MQVVRDAELSRRWVDKLVSVKLKEGDERWVYVHIEVQGQSDPDLARRLFTYNYRLFDRYDRLLEQQFLTEVHEYEKSQNMPCISG